MPRCWSDAKSLVTRSGVTASKSDPKKQSWNRSSMSMAALCSEISFANIIFRALELIVLFASGAAATPDGAMVATGAATGTGAGARTGIGAGAATGTGAGARTGIGAGAGAVATATGARATGAGATGAEATGKDAATGTAGAGAATGAADWAAAPLFMTICEWTEGNARFERGTNDVSRYERRRRRSTRQNSATQGAPIKRKYGKAPEEGRTRLMSCR
mmetsp:Transcript_30741/g.70346  ORF Transcript_30741/g.70346 Transcript_30741/m.70346 type:complete len:218 (+) Transcript_30741:140-793(+)